MTNQQIFNKNTYSSIVSTVRRMPILINMLRIFICFFILTFHLVVEKTNISYEINTFFNPLALYVWLFVYGLLILFLIFFPDLQSTDRKLPSSVSAFDILMMTVLMNISGGIDNGFGILVLPFVATSCIFSLGMHAFAYASIATILIFINVLFPISPHESSFFMHDEINFKDTFQAGILSLACFFVSVLTSYGTKNIQKAMSTVKKHEDEINRLNKINQMIIDSAQDRIVATDIEGNVIVSNKLAQKTFRDLYNNVPFHPLDETVRRWREHPYEPFEGKFTHHTYEYFAKAVPIPYEESPILVLFIRSQTDLAAEAKSLKLASLGQLTANLAHEIRNPLSAINHANELLGESLSDEFEVHLQTIMQSNISRINKMIQEILSLNRRDKAERKPTDMADLVSKFALEFQLSIPESVESLKLDLEKGLIANIDSEHLSQVLWNLVYNAWKFSSKGEDSIEIKLATNPTKSCNLLLSVSDDGEGVSEEDVPHIFEPFFTKSSEGTGLGLFVARELCEANGGELNYEKSTNSFIISFTTCDPEKLKKAAQEANAKALVDGKKADESGEAKKPAPTMATALPAKTDGSSQSENASNFDASSSEEKSPEAKAKTNIGASKELGEAAIKVDDKNSQSAEEPGINNPEKTLASQDGLADKDRESTLSNAGANISAASYEEGATDDMPKDSEIGKEQTLAKDGGEIPFGVFGNGKDNYHNVASESLETNAASSKNTGNHTSQELAKGEGPSESELEKMLKEDEDRLGVYGLGELSEEEKDFIRSLEKFEAEKKARESQGKVDKADATLNAASDSEGNQITSDKTSIKDAENDKGTNSSTSHDSKRDGKTKAQAHPHKNPPDLLPMSRTGIHASSTQSGTRIEFGSKPLFGHSRNKAKIIDKIKKEYGGDDKSKDESKDASGKKEDK